MHSLFLLIMMLQLFMCNVYILCQNKIPYSLFHINTCTHAYTQTHINIFTIFFADTLLHKWIENTDQNVNRVFSVKINIVKTKEARSIKTFFNHETIV